MPKEVPNGTNKGPEETQKIFFFLNNLAVEKGLVKHDWTTEATCETTWKNQILLHYWKSDKQSQHHPPNEAPPERHNSNHQTNPDSLPSEHSTPVCQTIPDSSEDSFKNNEKLKLTESMETTSNLPFLPRPVEWDFYSTTLSCDPYSR